PVRRTTPIQSLGFTLPPASPRIISRLRRNKELEVNRAGVITLVGDEAAAPVTETPEREESSERVVETSVSEAPPVARVESTESVELDESVESAESPDDAVEAEAGVPDPRNREGAHLQTATDADTGRRRRRSRRGGRRRRGRGGDGRDGGGRRPGGGGGG